MVSNMITTIVQSYYDFDALNLVWDNFAHVEFKPVRYRHLALRYAGGSQEGTMGSTR